jgi:hypothetical protein
MYLKLSLRCLVATCALIVLAWTRKAHAYPGFSPGEGYITSSVFGGVGNGSGCNTGGCHFGGTPPSTVSMQANGGGFLSIAGRNFAVPMGQTNHFQVHVSPPTGSQPAAGFLVFHTDGSTGDGGGQLHTFNGAQHSCKSPGTDGVGGCNATGNNNTEVMHNGGAVNGGGGTITLDFDYDSPNACASHSFRIWINAVNFDGTCFASGDAAAAFDFSISTTGACNDGNACTTGDACLTNGTCGSGSPVTCGGADQCHSVGACNPGSGCPAPVVLTGNPCNDFNACTNGTTCQSNGSCGGGAPVTCPTPDQCHSQPACVPASGCPAQIALTGNPCNDGNACTGPDACAAGVCGGPNITCPAPNQCQTGGGCNMASGCIPVVNKSDGTLCGAASFCSAGNVFHPHQTCTTGACNSPATTNCNGTCDPVTGCGGCNTDADCLANNYCDNTGTCVPFKATGTCNVAAGAAGGDCKTAGCHECATNNCVDGFCCDTACGGGSTTDCVACNVGGKQGTCSSLNLGTACNADNNLCTQNDACNATGTCVAGANVVCAAPQACQQAGICDPTTGTCNYAFQNGTQCAAAVCQADGITLLQRSLCPGNSATCPAQVPLNCFPQPCVAGACTVGCTVDTNCAPGAFCNAGACAKKRDNSQTCATDNQCTSNHCADGVCCDQACSGQCEACDVGGSVGTCKAITGNPHGTVRPQCASDGPVCGGTCDGVNNTGCHYPDNTASCRPESCDPATNTGTLAAGCNSAGACPAKQTISCGNFICGATRCNGNCTDDTQCTSTSFCAAGICIPKKDNGTACGMPHECTSNVCTDGVCCDMACGGQCQACDVNGSVGKCISVPSGPPHGGRLRCDGTGACQASCTGASPTACTFPDNNQLCGNPSCDNGTEVQIATCNGAGQCNTPTQKDCTPYACGVTSCRTACASPVDCARGFDCVAGHCISPDAEVPGMDAATAEDATAPVPDASVSPGADASTEDVSAPPPDVSNPVLDGATSPDGGVVVQRGDGAAGNLDVVAPEFEGGSCACRMGGANAPGRAPAAAMLSALGLGIVLARRRRRADRRRWSV